MTAPRPATALILAAGRGERLRALLDGRPKGFLSVGGETLIARSLDRLLEQGVRRVVIVAGYAAAAYLELARTRPGLEVVLNDRFAETGSFVSLLRGLERVDEDCLLLESDLLYERRALSALLDHAAADALLASGPTGATDEVWVEADAGRVRNLSKRREELRTVGGEYVGIVRVSRGLADVLRALENRAGAERWCYDTDALPRAARRRELALCLVPDLLWGEVDDERHHARVTLKLWPLLQARDR